MAVFLRKYGTGTGADVWIPIIKRAVVDFAVSADWTPAAGDVKVSKDGAAAANIGTLPTALAMGNGAVWKFVFSDAELQCKVLTITIVDSATKAVEDQSFIVETYGHAAAMYQADLSAANLPANVAQLLGTAWLAPAVAGTPDVNVKQLSGDATAADNAEAFFDGTGYAGTNNVMPRVTLCDTTTVNTDMLTPANVRTAVGLASANLDTQLSVLAAYIDTEIASIKAKTDNLPASPASVADIPTASANATAVLAATVDTLAVSKILELLLATVAGKAVPSGSTVAFKKRDGTTTITITYGSSDGERTDSVIA